MSTSSPPSPETTTVPRDPDTEARVAAFCSRKHPEIFHAIAYRNDIWKADPFDVETIHEEARAMFQRLVERAANPEGPSTGPHPLAPGRGR